MLNAGQLVVRGDFVATDPQTSFLASRELRVLFDGRRRQRLRTAPAVRSYRAFPYVAVAAQAEVVLETDMTILNDLEVDGSFTVEGNRTLTVGGALIVRATGALNNRGSMSVGRCELDNGATITGTNPCQE